MASLTTDDDDDDYRYFKGNVESSAVSSHKKIDKKEPVKIKRRKDVNPAKVPLPNIGVTRTSPTTVPENEKKKKKGSDRPTSMTAISADGTRRVIPYAAFPSPSKPKKVGAKVRVVGKNLDAHLEEADKKPLERKGAISEDVEGNEYDEEEWLDELESIIPVNLDSLIPLTAEQERELRDVQLGEAEDEKWLAQTFPDQIEDFKFGELSLLDTLTTEELKVNEIIHRIDNGDLSEEEGHKMLAQIHEDLKRTGRLSLIQADLLEHYIEKPCKKKRSLKINGPKKATLTNHIKIKF